MKLFWKCYRIEYRDVSGKLTNIGFIRGKTWDVVTQALENAKEKSEKEKTGWFVWDIKRID